MFGNEAVESNAMRRVSEVVLLVLSSMKDHYSLGRCPEIIVYSARVSFQRLEAVEASDIPW